MKFGVTLNTVLLIVLTTVTSFCQRQMTRDEILIALTKSQKPVNKDSLFRFDIHTQTRTTFDNLLKSGVDTILVYSVSYPGTVQVGIDSCSTIDPVYSYFFWKRQGKYLLKKVNGKCEGGQSATNSKVIKFISGNFSKMADEFFMSVTYGVVEDGDEFRISGNVIVHEPNYEILLQLGDKFKYLGFTDSELTDKKSLFYDHNHNLTSYKLFRLIKKQIK